MRKEELQNLGELIAEKERDLVVYEQAMVNFSAMLRDNKFNPALLEHGSERADMLIEMVYKEIANVFPRAKEMRKKDEHILELEQELKRLKSRNLWRRIFNK